ncbi:MAG TPA: hypothetical protein VF169_01240 [Albitalea sp.]|uniref:hypothetical protein n=1 Tax=Piscinibacter sp. TaxID=1903157 RepID=UPI002ED5EFE0
MANPLRSLDLLLRIKRRAIERKEEAAAAQAQQVDACAQQHAQAVGQEEACRADEAQCMGKIEHLTTRTEGFRPNDVVTLRHVLEMLADKTKRAAAGVAQAAQQLQAAQEELARLRREVRRAQQQLEQLLERRKQLAQQLELADEDVQDEDSEETAVARILAAQREEEHLLDTVGA